jgi:protein-L-isoaspartate(D-aspartate) O-methyltransferase
VLTIEQYREFYAEEVCAVAGVESQEMISAFARVPREQFLGPPPWRIPEEPFLGNSRYRTVKDERDIYHNVLVALKSEQSLNNGQPSALASWIAALDLTPGDRVFHVGCGTGYYTAIMAELVGSAGALIAAEVDPELAAEATENLRDYAHVTVHSGDGATIDPGQCDAMLINAGVTHPHLPWLHRLKEDGRTVLPLTVVFKPGSGMGVMAKITHKQGAFPSEIVSMVGIYSSTSVRDPEIEPLLSKALTSRDLLKLKSVRIDAHEQTDTCIVHSPQVCLSAADVEFTA